MSYTSYQEWREHPDCVRTDADFWQIARNAGGTMRFYSAMNLGPRSQASFFEVEQRDIGIYYHTLFERKGAGNPEAEDVFNFEDRTDPRLALRHIIKEGAWLYLVVDTPINIEVGDDEGVWERAIGDAYQFQAYFLEGRSRYARKEHFGTWGIAAGAGYPCNEHLIFTTQQAADDYVAWAKQDETSIARDADLMEFVDSMDRCFDSERFDDDDDIMRDDYREQSWKMPDDIAARGDMG